MLYFARWKTILVVAVSLLGILFAMPNMLGDNVLKDMPDWVPHKKVNLGLDLQGGVHLLIEVDTDGVINEHLESLKDEVRQTLREARIGYTGLRINKKVLNLRIRKREQFDEALEKVKELAAPVQTSMFSGLPGGDDISVETGEGQSISVTLTKEAVDHLIKLAVEQSIEVLRRRIDLLGTTEPTIQRQGVDRILVQVPGLDDPERLKKIIGKTAKLAFRLVDLSTTPEQALASRPPPGSEIIYSNDARKTPYVIKKRVMVAGESLVDSQPGFDQRTNEPIVTFRFDSAGAKRFGKVTQANVGRPFAIILDNEVISAPVIREAILGGSGQISGGFSVEQANDLSILLRAGALPAKLNFLEERSVGPGLGADSVAAGEIAALIGMAAVVIYILISYGLFGVFANLALAVNLALIMGILSLLQATLTLPGIAGIVLTIGMAVDANVLIFERIREEARNGKTPLAAIDAGYSKALGTILDANITTFIAAVILFQMGSGPVRGFAVTLAIGILTSVFTAFTLTRLFVSIWVHKKRPDEVPI